MSWPTTTVQTRYEHHFDNRVVRCFAERPHSVDQLLHDAVTRNPESVALISGDTRINYRQLAEQVNAVAANLAVAGLTKGDRIALLLSNRPEFLIALFAAARLGAITVPINIREQTPQLQYILNQCGAKVLVHEADLSTRLPQAVTLPDLQTRYAIGDTVADAIPFSDLLQASGNIASTAVVDEEPAIILYTSGTTGQPKGAMLTHFNIAHSLRHFELCMQLTAQDRSILAVPASHVTGVIAILLTMVHVGGSTVLMPTFKAPAFLQLAECEQITHSIVVPAMFNLCLLEPNFTDYQLDAWRIGGFGGAPMPEATIGKLAQHLPNLVLMNAYGATETTSPATLMPIGHTADHSDSVGRIVPCADIRVMDENGHQVEPGTAGELWIHGPMVIPGYWNNPAATAASFVAGHWRSGDIGCIDAGGYVHVFDRKKDLINRGGYKIYSIEIENVLSYHPAVIECAAVARPDPVLGEKIEVFLRCEPPDVSIDELKQFCGKRLADYKIPDFMTVLDQPLPRNANGKVLKTQLRKQAKG